MNKDFVITDAKKLLKIELKNKNIDFDNLNFPKRIFLLADSLYDEMVSRDVGEFAYSIGGKVYRFKGYEKIGFVKSKMCSPAIAIQAEELIAAGTVELIHIGFAGGLNNEVTIGDFILTHGAYNDTAVARLYGFDQEIINSNETLTDDVNKLFKSKLYLRRGFHWTTDAGYHETWKQVLKYKEKGALCVEMEGVGLFTVANYHGVKATGIYIISDTLNHEGWTLGWEDGIMNESITRLIDSVLQTLG